MAANCPNCKKPVIAKFKPFCSDRCRMLDLGQWLSGGYAIPAVELDDVSEEGLQKLEDPTLH